MRNICSMPRAQRMRWPICSTSRSVASPAASGMRRYADFQPLRCSFSAVWASSVTVSVANPPILSMRGAAQHGAGTAEERGVPEVVAVLHAGRRTCCPRPAPACRRRGCAGTDRANRNDAASAPAPAWLAHQPAHGHLQEGAGRHVVAVENGDEFAIGHAHRVVEVAGLGVLVVGTDDVAAAAPRRRSRGTPAGARRPECTRAACRAASRSPSPPARWRARCDKSSL